MSIKTSNLYWAYSCLFRLLNGLAVFWTYLTVALKTLEVLGFIWTHTNKNQCMFHTLAHKHTQACFGLLLHWELCVPLFIHSAWVSSRHLNLHYHSRHISLSCGSVFGFWRQHHSGRKQQQGSNVSGTSHTSVVNTEQSSLYFYKLFLSS